MRMGYHRDPSHFTGITPLQGEMRRRLWATVTLSDILISGQMGMPRMVCQSQCDTAEPRNLNDTDFDASTNDLPPARPETEYTTTLGIIARYRMVMALGAVSDLTARVKSCDHAEIMKVDAILLAAAANIPPPLRHRPMAASVTDSPQVIMARLFLIQMFYKGQVILHRRFLTAEPAADDREAFNYSRKSCLDASLNTLQIQHVLDEETCPGDQLHTMKWRVTSIMNHQFLTATMALCSLLYRRCTMGRKSEILAALVKTRAVWMRRSTWSSEAKKAAVTVSIVLARVSDSTRENGVVENDGVGQEGDLNAMHPPSGRGDGNDAAAEVEIQSLLQINMGLYDPDPFVMPSPFDLTLAYGQQGQYLNLDFEMRDTSVDDWMSSVTGPGTGW